MLKLFLAPSERSAISSGEMGVCGPEPECTLPRALVAADGACGDGAFGGGAGGGAIATAGSCTTRRGGSILMGLMSESESEGLAIGKRPLAPPPIAAPLVVGCIRLTTGLSMRDASRIGFRTGEFGWRAASAAGEGAPAVGPPSSALITT